MLHPGVPVMWYGHIKDLSLTAESCMGGRLPNVTLLHWAKQPRWCKAVKSKPEGHNGIDTTDSDLNASSLRLSHLQRNPGPARRNPTNIVSAACGQFHEVLLQEACHFGSSHFG